MVLRLSFCGRVGALGGNLLEVGRHVEALRTPEFFEVVVGAHGGLHAVHDDFAAVHEHPFAGVASFQARNLAARFAHGAAHGLAQGAGLAVACARADHDAREGAGFARRVEHDDVAGLDVVKRVDDDGKKFFDVKETRLMDILNVPITVVDFETNVKTKQGEGRYCVLFEQNGQRSKFITNCYNLKDVLDQAREAENNGQKIFPVENVIVKRRSLGDGKSAYYFEE